MFNRARFIHHQTPGDRFNGFSVLMSPAPSDRPSEVYVAVTYCSKEDQFCKATARDVLQHDFEHQLIPIVLLPHFLAECEARSWGYKLGRDARYHSNRWAWVYKYFL